MLVSSIRLELVLFVAAVAVTISTAVIIALRPWLARYALAHPNARSSHHRPTPQGGGIAVIGATIIAVAGTVIYLPQLMHDPVNLTGLFFSTVGLAAVGATDDLRPIEPLPRLLLQAVAAVIVIATLPADVRIFPILPWWIESALMLVGMLWFINLTNFMDGIDWMTVAEVAPVTGGLIVAGLVGALSAQSLVLSAALFGAILGFAPFNRPVARLFIGDVGSLPIGLLLVWLLILLGAGGHITAALLLPLYYLADATITLLRRLLKGEPIMQAHRSHFYQRAGDRGLTVKAIIARVFTVNLTLAGFAISTILIPDRSTDSIILLIGMVLVGWLLFTFGGTRSVSKMRNDSG